MQTHIYPFCLLAFSIVLINARFVFRSVDGGQDGEIRYLNNHPYHTHHVDAYQKLLEDILETELRAGKSNLIDLQSLDRTRKGIERGDPREFMG
ncbi:unnamed protein product [Adineta ricciae]|uniref:Uncharacterized protein n=1 Tax=Adineta ricciae TaxID=249248 RepID=A0A814FV94_ADIRI|nr:unnamed protein product [Adineta ricciae]CAF0990552.1 unnamed protein product [Adineta ricciae]